jgi:hypothetical protein
MRQTTSRIFASALLALMLAGCAVGPNYKRPAVTSPKAFRGAPTAAPDATSFGD